MEAKTLQALKESIAHWERMRDGAQAKHEGPYWFDCPLCKLFIDNEGCDRCEGCPIAENSGQECSGTPYNEASEFWLSKNRAGFKDAAQKMIDYLKSLLPTTEQECSDDHP